MTSMVPTTLTIRAAFEHHLEVFGSASSRVIRMCYPGLSYSGYAKAYRDLKRRPVLREKSNTTIFVHEVYYKNKCVPLDEAAQAMGDALVTHLWSGNGETLIGERLDWRLLQLGLTREELPSTAARGFLGRSVVLSDSGTIFIPLYVGAGKQSADGWLKQIEDRFFDTWQTILALPRMTSVVVIAYGMCSYRFGTDVLKEIASRVDTRMEARGISLKPRALNQLHWSYGFLQLKELPLTQVNLVFHAMVRGRDGSLRAALGWPPNLNLTPKANRQWIWRGGDVKV